MKEPFYGHFPIIPKCKIPYIVIILGSSHMTGLYPNMCKNEECYKGTELSACTLWTINTV